VIRRPGMDPTWGVSWSEIVDQSAGPPAPETVEWYRARLSSCRRSCRGRVPADRPRLAHPRRGRLPLHPRPARRLPASPLAKRAAAP
jgi:hypothetical protein